MKEVDLSAYYTKEEITKLLDAEVALL